MDPKFESLESLNYNQLLKLLGVLVLSEGYINHSRANSAFIRLATLSSSIEQHALFEEMCLKLFNKKPRKYIYKIQNPHKKSYLELTHSELSSSKAIKELYELSPTFKTSPGQKMSSKQFLTSPQPTINFLFDEPNFIKELALRVWFDFDGSIVPSFKLKTKRDKKINKTYNYFQIQFECEIYIAETNPHLVKDLMKLCELVGLNARIKYDKRKWSGIDGICISDLNSVKKFVRLGPITDIKISSKSNRFYGVKKRDMCKAVSLLISDNSISLSKHFKDKKTAINHRKHLNNLLKDKVKSVLKAP